MRHEEVSIQTRDGQCPTHILAPDEPGSRPAVLFFMDALAMRPTLIEMAGRLAEAGYLVLVPDMFYRFGPYAPLDPREVLAGDFRATIGPMIATSNNALAASDTQALLDYLDTRGDVAGPDVGTVGFCMGGRISLFVAGTVPGRIAAAASFHAGHLATDDPSSPHRLAAQIRGEIYVAGADRDHGYPPEMAQRLDDALTQAGVAHRCEIYPGAAHGWMVPDFPVYDPIAAEQGWTELFALFARNLTGNPISVR